MSVIAEYETTLTQLSSALEAVPEMTVRHDEIYFTSADEVKWLYWGVGADQADFLAALDDDPSVESVRIITETPTQQLYSATLTGSPDDFTLTVFNELDIQIIEATHSHEGTVVRVRCPSREAYSKLGDVIKETYGTFRTLRLFQEETDTERGYSVTPDQHEALLCALDLGYFEVPRDTSLQALARELGVSDNAVSARLRRGTSALLRDTLARP